jgi:MFS family permease
VSEPESDPTRSTRSPVADAFRVRFFGVVWTANLLHMLAGQMHLFTLQWLVTDLTPSRTTLGLVLTIAGLTVTLSSPLAGVAADRFPKRDLLIIGRLGVLAVVLAPLGLVYSGTVEIWHVLVCAGAYGFLQALTQPATQTYVFDVVGREGTQTAVALNSAGMGIGQMGAPALAGLLIAASGVVGSWIGAALGLLFSILLLARVPIRGMPSATTRAPLRELREGFAYVIAHPPVLLALLACSMSFFNGALFAMRPVFARHVLEVGSQGMGMMAASAGIGTLIGALLATRRPTIRHPGRAIVLSMLGFSGCILAYAFAFSYEYILVVEFASGVFAQLWQISAFSGLQMSVAEAVRGRVIGLVFMVAQLAHVGGVFVGRLADGVGDQLAMGIFGVIPVVALLGLYVLGRSTLDQLDTRQA